MLKKIVLILQNAANLIKQFLILCTFKSIRFTTARGMNGMLEDPLLNYG